MFHNISLVQMNNSYGIERMDGTSLPTESTDVDAEDTGPSQRAAIDVGRTGVEVLFLSIVIAASKVQCRSTVEVIQCRNFNENINIPVILVCSQFSRLPYIVCYTSITGLSKFR